MQNTYNYDEIYGTLLNQNEDDTERTYFIIQCQFFKFYKWMFSHGWNLQADKPCERKGLKGYEVTITQIGGNNESY